MYLNIEKSAFRKSEYVGYASGRVYRIMRDDRGWYALNRDGTDAGSYLHRRTLKEMSAALADVAKVFCNHA